MKAIIDCNSFYCSCERVFQPALSAAPVVVLSNNDGCIISRSDEAKALGVGMAGPYFMAKELIEKNGVSVFSSNYNLYGNMSWRVMETLRQLMTEDKVEVYSVDEAFVDMAGLPAAILPSLATELKDAVELWTGVKVSVGVAPTKTLAKLANGLAKKEKQKTGGVLVLDTDEKIRAALQSTKVGDLWGIGRRQKEKLVKLGITTGWDLYHLPEEWARKNLGGVVGVRLIKELHGETAIVMEEPLKNKKMIATTRMFGSPVTDLASVKEAVATYASRAAEKLRRQHSAAGMISVFIVPKEVQETEQFSHGPAKSAYSMLPHPTSASHELIKPAVQLAEQIFVEGCYYKKAGVILSGLVPDDSIQGNLFKPSQGVGRMLMDMMDNINFSMRDDIVKFAASGTKRNWKMQQSFHSPRYTTRWNELYEVK